MSFCGVFSGSKGAHPSYYVASGRWCLVSYLHVRLQGNWLRFGYQLPGAMGNGHHCNMQLIGSIVAAVCRTLIIFSKDEKSSGVIAIVQVHCMGSYNTMHTHQATGDLYIYSQIVRFHVFPVSLSLRWPLQVHINQPGRGIGISSR